MAPHSVLKDHQTLRHLAAEVVLRVAALADEDAGTVTHQQVTVPRGEYLRQLAAKLDTDTFTLAVVGEFSRGKSSLINALLDQPGLLPTALEPNTAAVTVLSYAPELRVSVTFQDGTARHNLGPDDLARYAVGQDLDGRQRRAEAERRMAAGDSWPGAHSETDIDIDLGRGRPGEPRVAALHVGLPSPFLSDGICLVDTPGLGSVNPEHGEATRRFIDRADAVLFLVNTDPVIGESECHFLSFLRDYVDRFLFVVTKTDRFSPRERQESVSYTARAIEQYAGLARPPVYPVSAKLAVLGRGEPDEVKYAASGFPEFLDGLHRFLVAARGREFLGKQVGLAATEVRHLINATLVELQGLRLGRRERPGTVAAARSALRRADDKTRDILAALDRHLGRVGAALEAFGLQARMRLELQLADEVGRMLEGYDWDQLRRVSETIPLFLRDQLAHRLRDDFARAAEQLTAMRDDVLAACRRHLGELSAGLRLPFEGLRLPEGVTVTLDLDTAGLAQELERIGVLTLGSTLALTLAGVATVGPLAGVVIVAGLVARHTLSSALRADVKRRLKAALAPTLSGLLTEVFQNVRDDITRTAARFRQEVEELLQGATAGIDQSLSRLELDSPEEDTEARQERLRARLAELEDLQRELASLAAPGW